MGVFRRTVGVTVVVVFFFFFFFFVVVVVVVVIVVGGGGGGGGGDGGLLRHRSCEGGRRQQPFPKLPTVDTPLRHWPRDHCEQLPEGKAVSLHSSPIRGSTVMA